MVYNLIKYDWSVQARPPSVNVSGKAYICVYSFKGQPLYFLYTAAGQFEGLYWSESEARVEAAAKGMDCDEKLRSSPVDAEFSQSSELAQGLIL